MPAASEVLVIHMLPGSATTRREKKAWAVKKWTGGVDQFFTVKEYDETSGYIAKNLSGFTATLKVEMGSTLLVSGSCTLASSTLGYIYYSIASGAFPYVGRAHYQLELSMSGVKMPSEVYPLSVGRTI